MEKHIDLKERFKEIRFSPQFTSQKEALYEMSRASPNFDEELYLQLERKGGAGLEYLSLNAHLSQTAPNDFNLSREYYNMTDPDEKLLYFLSKNAPEILNDEEKEYVDHLIDFHAGRVRYNNMTIFGKVMSNLASYAMTIVGDVAIGGLSDIGYGLGGLLFELNHFVSEKINEESNYHQDHAERYREYYRNLELPHHHFRNWLREFNMKYTSFDDSFTLGLVNDTISGLGRLMLFMAFPKKIAAKAFGMSTAKKVSRATYMGQAMGRTYYDTLQRAPDINSIRLFSYTTISSMISYAANKIFSDAVFGRGGFNLIRHADRFIGSKAGYAITRTALEGFGEGVEEFADELARSIAYKLIVDNSEDIASIDTLLYSALIGAIVGGLAFNLQAAQVETRKGLDKYKTLRFDELISQTMNNIENLKKKNNVANFLANKADQHPELTEQEIIQKYNDEYNKAMVRDNQMLIQIDLANATLMKLLDLAGEETFAKAIGELSKLHNFYNAPQVDGIFQVSGEKRALWIEAKMKLFSEFPEINAELVTETITQQRMIENLENLTGKQIFLYKNKNEPLPVGHMEYKGPENKPDGFVTDGRYIAFDVDMFNKYGLGGAINKVVQHELGHLLQLDSKGRLSLDMIKKLHQDLQKTYGNVEYGKVKEGLRDAETVVKASERQADFIAENVLFEDASIQSLLMTNKTGFFRVYNWITDKINIFKRSNTEQGRLKFRKLLEAKYKYQNMIGEQMENDADLDKIKTKMNLTDKELQNIKKKQQLSGRFLKLDIDLTSNSHFKNNVTRFLRKGMGAKQRNMVDLFSALNKNNYTAEFVQLVEESFPNDSFSVGLNKLLSVKFGVTISSRYGIMSKSYNVDQNINVEFDGKLNQIQDIQNNKKMDLSERTAKVREVVQVMKDKYKKASDILNIDGVPDVNITFNAVLSNEQIGHHGMFLVGQNTIVINIPTMIPAKELNQTLNFIKDTVIHELQHAFSYHSGLGAGGNMADIYSSMRKKLTKGDFDFLINNMIDPSQLENFTREQLETAVAYRVYSLLDGEVDADTMYIGGSDLNESGFMYKNGKVRGFGKFQNIEFAIVPGEKMKNRLNLDTAAYDAISTVGEVVHDSGVYFMTKMDSSKPSRSTIETTMKKYIKNEVSIKTVAEAETLGFHKDFVDFLINPENATIGNFNELLKRGNIFQKHGHKNPKALKIFNNLASIIYSENENIRTFEDANNFTTMMPDLYALSRMIKEYPGEIPNDMINKNLTIMEVYELVGKFSTRSKYTETLNNFELIKLPSDILFRTFKSDFGMNISEIRSITNDLSKAEVNIRESKEISSLDRKIAGRDGSDQNLDSVTMGSKDVMDLYTKTQTENLNLNEHSFDIDSLKEQILVTLNADKLEPLQKLFKVIFPVMNATKAKVDGLKRENEAEYEDLNPYTLDYNGLPLDQEYRVLRMIQKNNVQMYVVSMSEYNDILKMLPSRGEMLRLFEEAIETGENLTNTERTIINNAVKMAKDSGLILVNDLNKLQESNQLHTEEMTESQRKSILKTENVKNRNINPDAMDLYEKYKQVSRQIDKEGAELLAIIIRDNLTRNGNEEIYSKFEHKLKHSVSLTLMNMIENKIKKFKTFNNNTQTQIMNFFAKNKSQLEGDFETLAKINKALNKDSVDPLQNRIIEELKQDLIKLYGMKENESITVSSKVDEITQKVEPKKVEPKKVEPKKVEPKKVEPKKVEPKKVEPKKVEPKKVEPKKVEPKTTVEKIKKDAIKPSKSTKEEQDSTGKKVGDKIYIDPDNITSKELDNLIEQYISMRVQTAHPLVKSIFGKKFEKQVRTQNQWVSDEFKIGTVQTRLAIRELLSEYRDVLSQINKDNADQILNDIADLQGKTPVTFTIQDYYTKAILLYIGQRAANNPELFTKTQIAKIEKMAGLYVSDAARTMSVHGHIGAYNIIGELDPVLELKDIFKTSFGAELEIDEQLIKDFYEAHDAPQQDYTKMSEIYEKIISFTAEQIPKQSMNFLANNLTYDERVKRFTHFVKKADSFRYMAMLSNVSTHIKNYASNVGLKGLETGTKRLIGIMNNKVDYHLSQLKEVPDGGEIPQHVVQYVQDTFVDSGWIKWQMRNKGNKYRFGSDEVVYKAEMQTIFNSKTLSAINKLIERSLMGIDNKFMIKEIGRNLNNLIAANFADQVEILNRLNNEYKEQLEKHKNASPEMKQKLEREFNRKKMEEVSFISDGSLEIVTERAIQQSMKTYLKAPTALVKMLTNLAEQGPAYSFMVKSLFPFARVSANILLQTWEYSPGNLIKGLYTYFAIKSGMKLDEINKNLDGQVSKGDIRHGLASKQLEKLKEDPFHQAQAVRNIAKGTIGTTGYALGIILALSGILRIDEEDQYMGMTLVIGDNFKVRMSDLAPSVTPMLMGAALIYTSEKYPSRYKNFIRVFSDQSVLGTFDNMLNFNRSWIDVPLGAAENYLAQFVPAISRSLARVIDQGEKNMSNNRLLRRILRGIPLLSYAVPNQIDPYTGETLYKAGSAGTQAMMNLLGVVSPTRLQLYVKSDLEKEAINIGAEISRTNMTYTVNGEQYTISGRNNEMVFAKKRAEVVNKELSKLIRSARYRNMSEEEKRSAFNSVYYQATLTAKIDHWTNVKNKVYVFTNRDTFLKYTPYLSSNNIRLNPNFKGSRFVE